MKIPRQSERRARFDAAFANMPLWETWATKPFVVKPGSKCPLCGKGVTLVDCEYGYEYCFHCRWRGPLDTKERQHCKSIPRRVRRDMARKRSLREYRRDHNLPETC